MIFSEFMKKTFLVIFLIICSLDSKAQIRSNEPLPVIDPIVKGKISNATGWLKDRTGQWISAKNKIPYDLEDEFKSLANYYHYKLGENRENFISFEIRDIKIDSVDYKLLIKKYNDGFYKYESINEGWTTSNSCTFYVFELNEFKKINEIEMDMPNEIALKFIYQGDLKYTDLAKLTDLKISKQLYISVKESYNSYISNILNFSINPMKSKNKVQFLFYSYFDSNVDKYYETDWLNFNKFIKIE